MNEIYFSETYTNIGQKNIKLEFSKKITKNEKTFLKSIFFKIISDFSLLENMKISLEELGNNPELSSIDDYSLFTKNLSEKRIFFSVSSSSEKYEGSFGIISSFIFNTDSILLFFTEEFKSCFSNKKNFFSLLEIEKFIFMSESFSFSLYNNILKNFENSKEIILPISSLKMYLNSYNKYSRFFDFEKYILKKSVSDINIFTTFNISYKKIKEGTKLTNKITSITFSIEKSRHIDKSHDNAVYKMMELVKDRIKNPEKIYQLFLLYIAKRGYKYVYENIKYLKHTSSENFDKKLRKALLLDLASNSLKLYISINKSVDSSIVLFSILSRNINDIKRYFPKIEKLLQTSELKNINSISYFKDGNIFEFVNEDIEIYVEYYINKPSLIKIYLPDNIIKKLEKNKPRLRS